MKALVIGATGATGKDLVDVLSNDPAYTEINIFVRRHVGITHPKVKEILTDFNNLEDVSTHITGDILFSCLGTTLKASGSKENQWHIDYKIPADFADIAKRNGVAAIVLLSAYGASVRSLFFYSRIKGALEDKITSLSFKQSIIFRPGFLLRKNTDRTGERISTDMIQLLNSVGLVKNFRPLPTRLLAEKMAKVPKELQEGRYVIQLDKIFKL